MSLSIEVRLRSSRDIPCSWSAIKCWFLVKIIPDGILWKNQRWHKILISQLKNRILAVQVQLALVWDTYLRFNCDIVNFVQKTDEGEVESIILLTFVLWWYFYIHWVKDGGVGAKSLIQAQLKSYLFPAGILAKTISMTHSGMPYQPDISKSFEDLLRCFRFRRFAAYSQQPHGQLFLS